MIRIFIILILTFPTTLMFGQKNNSKQIEISKPFVLGVIDEIQSKELAEKRILNIYLPEGYNQDDTIKYPVIYLLDGSADEDFIHIVGLVQFNSFEWINQVPKSIVVGIATVDRRRDFTFPTTIEEDKKNIPQPGSQTNSFHLLKRNYNHLLKRNIEQIPPKLLSGNH